MLRLALLMLLALGPSASLAAAGGEAPPWRRAAFPSTYRPLPRADTLIVHATILDGAGRRIDDGEILMAGGRFVAVGRALQAPPGVVRIDARGRWVTPGLVDVHSHDGTYAEPLTSLDDKSSDVSELSDPDAAGIWIETGIDPQNPAFERALAGGVTTLQVLPGSDPVIGGRSVVLKPIPAPTVQQMKFPLAPQGLKMACGENPKVQDAAAGRGPTSREGEIAFIRKAFADAAAYREAWGRYLAGGPGERPRDDPTLDTLAAVLDGQIAVHMHCYRSDEMATMLDLSHEIGFRISAFHHAVEAYKIAPLLAREGVCAAVWSDWWGFKMEALDGIRENAAFVDAAGGCVMMHSDSPQLGERLAAEAGKAAAAGRRAGLDEPPEHVIAWVTRNPARALGLDDRIGAIRPGLDADLVVWSGDPFSVYSHADLVFIDGALAFDRSDPARRPKSDFELGRAPMSPP